MDWTKCFVLLCFYCQLVLSHEPACVIDLSCRECVPDNMPLVPSHRAVNGSVTVPSGDRLRLSCGAGRLLSYPLLAAVTVRCSAGRYVVPNDTEPHLIFRFGCQENVFEDVLHEVENCAPPLQGRAYRLRDEARTVHLAAVCYDEDRGVTAYAHMTGAHTNDLRLRAHAEPRAPLSLFGNLNAMFDSNTRLLAERLYSDDASLNRRVRELFKHDKVSFADQTLTTGELLSWRYFEDQNMRVADFASNKAAVWKSVASGNLENVQRDVAKYIKMSRPHSAIDVYAGTYGIMKLRVGHAQQRMLFLRSWRFPVPQYIWTVAHDRSNKRATLVVVLNDPFVSVAEMNAGEFRDSACGEVSWLHELRRNDNYEGAVYGLTFCMGVHDTDIPLPRALLDEVLHGSEGLLL